MVRRKVGCLGRAASSEDVSAMGNDEQEGDNPGTSGNTIKEKKYKPRRKFRSLEEDAEATAVSPMQRIAHGKLAFLKHVNPSKVDLALKYAKLDAMGQESEKQDMSRKPTSRPMRRMAVGIEHVVPLTSDSTMDEEKEKAEQSASLEKVLKNEDSRSRRQSRLPTEETGERNVGPRRMAVGTENVVRSNVDSTTSGAEEENGEQSATLGKVLKVSKNSSTDDQIPHRLSKSPTDTARENVTTGQLRQHVFKDPNIADIADIILDIRDTLITGIENATQETTRSDTDLEKEPAPLNSEAVSLLTKLREYLVAGLEKKHIIEESSSSDVEQLLSDAEEKVANKIKRVLDTEEPVASIDVLGLENLVSELERTHSDVIEESADVNDKCIPSGAKVNMAADIKEEPATKKPASFFAAFFSLKATKSCEPGEKNIMPERRKQHDFKDFDFADIAKSVLEIRESLVTGMEK